MFELIKCLELTQEILDKEGTNCQSIKERYFHMLLGKSFWSICVFMEVYICPEWIVECKKRNGLCENTSFFLLVCSRYLLHRSRNHHIFNAFQIEYTTQIDTQLRRKEHLFLAFDKTHAVVLRRIFSLCAKIMYMYNSDDRQFFQLFLSCLQTFIFQ